METRKLKTVFLVIFISFTTAFYLYYNSVKNNFKGDILSEKMYTLSTHEIAVKSFMDIRKIWSTSNLGKILFLNENALNYKHPENDNKVYNVLIWKHLKWLQNRHIKSFGTERTNPLDVCSVKNCIFTGNDDDLVSADAVVVHLQKGQVPVVQNRSEDQIWVFLNDEAPPNAFSMSKSKHWTSFVDIFNWSMTYRSDSDVPVPYGRVVPLSLPKTFTENLIPNWKNKRKDVLVAILTSNCVNFRMDYINKLKNHIDVHVYGRCSQEFADSCPGHFKADCKPIGDYLFYLVFENSKCKEYLTEKAFFNAFSKGSIPVIMGPSVEETTRLLPPNSFLHVDFYTSTEELAKDVYRISKDNQLLKSYHDWRRDFEVVNEHGYFKTSSQHFCRICEALNYNHRRRKIYDLNLLGSFLDPKLSCRK